MKDVSVLRVLIKTKHIAIKSLGSSKVMNYDASVLGSTYDEGHSGSFHIQVSVQIDVTN